MARNAKPEWRWNGEKREPKKGYSLPMHLGISGTSFKVLSSRKAKRIKGEGQRKKNEV